MKGKRKVNQRHSYSARGTLKGEEERKAQGGKKTSLSQHRCILPKYIYVNENKKLSDLSW